ncbi:MAG: flagellar hook-length control protein FliK [Pseudomonadota bacterium]
MTQARPAASAEAAVVRIDGASPDAPPPLVDLPETRVETASTRAEAPPRSAAPETPPAVARVETALRRLESGEIEIRLDPPELGRVRVSLAASEAGLVATVLAERPEAADLMRRHAEALARGLAEAGHEEVTLQFGSDGRRDAPDRGRPDMPGQGDGFGPVAPKAPSGPVRIAVAGLDLRV